MMPAIHGILGTNSDPSKAGLLPGPELYLKIFFSVFKCGQVAVLPHDRAITAKQWQMAWQFGVCVEARSNHLRFLYYFVLHSDIARVDCSAKLPGNSVLNLRRQDAAGD